jgi:alpha-glucosidase
MRSLTSAILSLVLLCPALAAGGSEVISPGGALQVRIDVDAAGRPFYAVSLDAKPVILQSRLGLSFGEGRGCDTGLAITDARQARADTTWEQPWGERRRVRDHHNELLVDFRARDDAKVICRVRVRVFDDGVGFRYEIPEQGGGPVDVVEELTEFRVAPDAVAWWQPADDPFKYEVLYTESPVGEINKAHSPLTMRLPTGTYVALHEAALVDYPAYALERTAPGVLRTALRPWSDGVRARTRGSFVTPWRTIQVAPDAVGLINSDLVLNLNEPNQLGNVDWVEPGKYVGVWWAIHLGRKTWEQGPNHGATTAEAKRHVDFAAQYGFDGVLLEGWNIGWGEGEAYSFLDVTPDLDLEAVAAYAADRGVRLVGHHETFGDIPAYEAALGDAFDFYESLGVRQVKTGYVGSAGSLRRIDDNGDEVREWHDSQYAVRHQLRVLEQAAKRKISINTHEPVKDTGLRRTYPNWLTREGARGQEFAVWGQLPNPPEHIPMLAFTRMLAGPLDFTPGLFDLAFEARGESRRVASTLARQLALYVVLYSPIHMVPDLVENYEKYPDAFQFIVDVPTDWDESLALDGAVGDFVVMARKERGADDWYVGAVTDGQRRAVQVPLAFLDAGRRYIATIYADGDDADWASRPHDYAITEKKVDRDSVLGLNLAAGGGAAVRIRPADGGTE